MTAKIYKQLARHPDDLPGGFPLTDNGVELRILQRLFTQGSDWGQTLNYAKGVLNLQFSIVRRFC